MFKEISVEYFGGPAATTLQFLQNQRNLHVFLLHTKIFTEKKLVSQDGNNFKKLMLHSKFQILSFKKRSTTRRHFTSKKKKKSLFGRRAEGDFLVQGSDGGGTFCLLFWNLHKI